MIENILAKTENFFWLKSSNYDKNINIEHFYYYRMLELLGEISNKNANLLELMPNPNLMKDLSLASKRVIKAILNKEKIYIAADYDVDGITSAVLLKKFFKELNKLLFNVDIENIFVYIPDRINDGYGLNENTVDIINKDFCKLIITVDNGISAYLACDRAYQLGIDVIITDHHDIPPILPKAYAILNPKQLECNFPHKELAGVGVAFYLIVGIRAELRLQGYINMPNLREYLDFVAIGTIADMAPLTNINHILCKIGLEVLHENVLNNKRVGLNELIKISSINIELKPIDAVDIGFRIAPRINASGRLYTAKSAEILLSTDNIDEAKKLSEELNKNNIERQNIEKMIVEEAINEVLSMKIIPSAIVLANENWNPGVVGLVASRLVDKFYRPTLILGGANNFFRGSGRSIRGFDLFKHLNVLREHFVSFGGHSYAVGLSIIKENLYILQNYLIKKMDDFLTEDNCLPVLDIDIEIKFSDLNVCFYDKIEELEPFGIKNNRVKCLIKNVEIKNILKTEKTLTTKYYRVLLQENNIEKWVSMFSFLEQMEGFFYKKQKIDLILEPKIQFYNKQKKYELKIIDINKSFI